MKLYEIADQFAKLDSMVPEIDSQEDADAFTSLYSELEGTLSEKAHGLACVIRNTESDSIALDLEIKKLTLKRKSIDRKVQSLTDYMEFCLRAAGVDSVKTSIFDIVIKKNQASVQVNDELLIPSEYLRIKTEADKIKIKDALKAGQYVAGCELVNTEKVVIK
jgi:hypothetical protein